MTESLRNPKRILIFSLAYIPFVGGAELALRYITDRIEPSDIEFHMVTLRFDALSLREEKIGNITLHRIGFGRRGANTAKTFNPLFYLSKILFIPLAAYEGMRLNRKCHFDAWWSMMSYMIFPIVLMRFCAVSRPFVVTLQEGDSFDRTFNRIRITPFLPLLQFGLRRATIVQAISNYLGIWARKLSYEGPVEVIPNGVAVRAFAHSISKERRHALRAEWSITEDDTVLISVSRLVHKNAVDIIIRALTLLPRHVHCIVLGDGPEEQALSLLAQELEVLPRIHFLHAVEHSSLPEYLHAADIFVRPSRSEGMGTAFIEAMASGIPVVATQVGGIADFLFDPKRNPEHKPTGFAVLPDSPDDIRAAIMEIRNAPELAADVIANAHTLVSDRYDWDIIARNMRERVFAKILV